VVFLRESTGEALGAGRRDVALLDIRRWDEAEGSARGIRDAARLTDALLHAGSPDDTLNRVIRFCWERYDRPVAGWSTSNDEAVPVLVGTLGIGPDEEHQLTDRIPRSAAGIPLSKRGVIARFERTVGTDQVGILDAGDGLVLVGRASGSVQEELDALASILADVLSHFAEVARLHRRIEDLDARIAVAAHEIRGPLLGVEKAIEVVLRDPDPTGPDRRLLQLARHDLRRLATDVEGLLRWSVGAESLHRRWTDLVHLVNDVVESCSMEAGPGTIQVRLPAELTARIDGPLVRAAIENVVRNALNYAEGHKVYVSAARKSGVATVTIRDRGPGIPPGERDLVFEPFARGSGHRSVAGRGLGLFIARRVVGAHGGAIRLESSERGSAFHLELPVDAA
jgi:signal transduction histidine kinase